ncbi:hypothetical protein [Capnocytophaga canimorsus]|nr:hypothetical protein [Capnocytophaga canimorsus]
MKKKQHQETQKEKIVKGLELSYQRMIAHKRKDNQKIVVMREGKIVTINP